MKQQAQAKTNPKTKEPLKDPARIAAAKKAWETKRAKANATPTEILKPVKAAKATKVTKVTKTVKAKKAPAKDPIKVAAAKKAWETKRAGKAKLTKQKKETKPKAKKTKKTKKVKAPSKKKVTKVTKAAKVAEQQNKIVNISPIAVSFTQIANLSGIPITTLRRAAKSKFDIIIAADSCYGISGNNIPALIAEVKTNHSLSKLEKIHADEIWFSEVQKKLGLSTKQLEIRCKCNNITTVLRYPELSFKSHYQRAMKKSDADRLISLYAATNLEQVKQIIQASL